MRRRHHRLRKRYGQSRKQLHYTDAQIRSLLFVPGGMSAKERTERLKTAAKQRGWQGSDHLAYIAKFLEREVIG